MCGSRFREDLDLIILCNLQAEDRVLSYIKGENRPFNVQLVADMMAQFGIKKPQVQRAVDALSEAGKITCKVRYEANLISTLIFTEVASQTAGVWEVQNLYATARRCGSFEQRCRQYNI